MDTSILKLIVVGFCFPAFVFAEIPSSRSDAANTAINVPANENGSDQNFMCGPHCIVQAAFLLGENYHSLDHISNLARTSPKKGTTLQGMLDAIAGIGLHGQVVRTTIEALSNDSRIAILVFGKNDYAHVVILDTVTPDHVAILDGRHVRTLSRDTFELAWTGLAILVDGGSSKMALSQLPAYLACTLKVAGILLLISTVSCILRSTLRNRKLQSRK